MESTACTPQNRGPWWAGILVLVSAAALAGFSALPYAGSWQDASRLAYVEALADYHTFAIDHSIFVEVPPYPPGQGPFPEDHPDLLKHGTLDKLLIGGHYYTDKPVPALIMAGEYKVWQWLGGPTARQDPRAFCLAMIIGTVGISYVLAVWCVYCLTGCLGLPWPWRLVLTASFGLSTVALTYARHVNVHMMLLAIGAAIFLGMERLAQQVKAGRISWLRFTIMGTLAGLGYTLDLGAGQPLLFGLLLLVGYRTRRPGVVAVTLLGALPWLALHHVINYALGGTWKPMNTVPEYFGWPGSPFTAANLTGSLNQSFGHFLVYAGALLLGKHGFVGHNLPLFLAVPALVVLLRRRPAELAEIIFAMFWSVGTWLSYAVLSNNYSGVSCSIRWFVPLLVPAYYLLGAFLREFPGWRRDFLLLSGWGLVLSSIMWWHGPWIDHMVPLFWPIQGAALATWLAFRISIKKTMSAQLYFTRPGMKPQALK